MNVSLRIEFFIGSRRMWARRTFSKEETVAVSAKLIERFSSLGLVVADKTTSTDNPGRPIWSSDRVVEISFDAGSENEITVMVNRLLESVQKAISNDPSLRKKCHIETFDSHTHR